MSWISKMLGGKANGSDKSNASGQPRVTPMTVADRQRMALRPPSFTEMLPYVRYSPKEQVFAMRDGATLGAMF